MPARIGPVYTRSGYSLPHFRCDYTGPLNFIGLPELLTQSRRPYHLFQPAPPILNDLDHSRVRQSTNGSLASLVTIAVTFELGATTVESHVVVLPYPFPPTVGTVTIFELIERTLEAAAEILAED